MNSKTKKLPVRTYWFVLVLVFAVLVYCPSYAVNVTFGWDPNDEPDLKGYRIYRNVESPGPPYKYRTTLQEKNLDDPLNPMVTLTGLKEDTEYYVALTAYNTDGNESDFSDDVCVQVVDSAIELCGSSTSSSSGGGGDSGGGSDGGGGGSGSFACFISAACSQTPGSLPSTYPFIIASVAFLFLPLQAAAKSIFISHRVHRGHRGIK